MATKIKIITTRDFIKVSPEGIIDISTSRDLLVDIAKAKRRPVDYDLLVDFRDSTWTMSKPMYTSLHRSSVNMATHFAGKWLFSFWPE